MAEKSLSARSLRAWIIRATSSLPVPDSPVMRTDVFEGATRPTRSSTRRAAGESPTKRRPAADRPVSSSSRRFSSSSRSRSLVRRSRWRRFSMAIPQRPASETRNRAVLLVEVRPCPRAAAPCRPGAGHRRFGRRRGWRRRSPPRRGCAATGTTRGARRSPTAGLSHEGVLGQDRLGGPPRKADDGFGAAPAPLSECCEVAARCVEHPDGAAQDVFYEGFLVRKRAERKPRIVERLEEEELVLSLKLRRPIDHRDAA